ncbi:50S ribosomal protein L17 [Salinibacter sp. 10B]|uniref:50S ribosomal protein L17 n=1 Tax=Salinibacter sp. 10B TaxID=1923971 RepID=UPI000CF36728|nr:50S ribosomal protein L17 [Salinibacter sp. 10B]
MRHRKKGKKLGRTSPHRKRTLQALSNALIENKNITTTIAKAKALRPFVEPLITRAKDDTEHNRRQVFRHLQNKETVNELFGEVAEKVGNRPGGYTRIIKLGQRSGDGAELALVELVDYNDVQPSGTGGGGSGGTRRGSGKGRRDEGDDTGSADESASDSSEDVSADAEEEQATATDDEGEPSDEKDSEDTA